MTEIIDFETKRSFKKEKNTLVLSIHEVLLSVGLTLEIA
jgi:hypothetical protein